MLLQTASVKRSDCACACTGHRIGNSTRSLTSAKFCPRFLKAHAR